MAKIKVTKRHQYNGRIEIVNMDEMKQSMASIWPENHFGPNDELRDTLQLISLVWFKCTKDDELKHDPIQFEATTERKFQTNAEAAKLFSSFRPSVKREELIDIFGMAQSNESSLRQDPDDGEMKRVPIEDLID